jgi:hypothetical protein
MTPGRVLKVLHLGVHKCVQIVNTRFYSVSVILITQTSSTSDASYELGNVNTFLHILPVRLIQRFVRQCCLPASMRINVDESNGCFQTLSNFCDMKVYKCKHMWAVLPWELYLYEYK